MKQVEGADGAHQQERPPLREQGFQRRVGPASAAPHVGRTRARASDARVPVVVEHGFVLVDGRAHGRGEGGGRRGGGEWRQNDGRVCLGTGRDEDEDEDEDEALCRWAFWRPV